MDIGQEIGLKAHLLFPGGVLIDEEPWQHAEAVTHTAALMIDARVPAIFEAAFEYENIRIRVDVLERLAAATLAATGQSSGIVSVSTIDSFAARWLMPRLSRFRRVHGDIDVRVATSERLADFKRPKQIHITETIPRTATGKIQRGVVARAYNQNVS